MCGICGMFNYSGGSIDDSVLRKMNLSIAHRGPDGEGYFSSGSFGFAMRRLSIIDKQRGTQPVKNEDGKLYCIFNGEIYNYKYLRQELIKDGHIFKTDSDTEIIVHLYEKYGDEFVKYIHGMFAIALWDCQKERLLLVRDRVGVKPLFYTVNAGVFSFCSELQGLVNAGLTGGDMLTYGDGVSDIDIKGLLSAHRAAGKLATMTAVQPSGRFGALVIDGNDTTVTSFMEKPRGDGAWINGGFFVCQPEVFDYIDGDDTVFERSPLERLAKEKQLNAYKHGGFWMPMDTMRDKNELNVLWASGRAPWAKWLGRK